MRVRHVLRSLSLNDRRMDEVARRLRQDTTVEPSYDSNETSGLTKRMPFIAICAHRDPSGDPPEDILRKPLAGAPPCSQLRLRSS
jgi:hypothetical protein